ncbi:MAG: ABC transporter permease [Sumerlaeia bacterium]
MNLWTIANRYCLSRPLVTLLTVLGVALGAALISSVLTLRRETESTFIEQSSDFDLVVGAKGSPLQLVLSSLYHLDVPTGNIGYPQLERLRADSRVTAAVPFGLGDNLQGFRIVGTDLSLFDVQRRLREGDPVAIFHLAEGELFSGNFEAVLGAQVARETGLGIGDQFAGTHGLISIAGSETHDDFPYTVTGILEPSGTSHDRAIFTTIESVWGVHDAEAAIHAAMFGGSTRKPAPEPEPEAEAGDDEDVEVPSFLMNIYANSGDDEDEPESDSPYADREVTAVLVQLKTPGLRLFMSSEINTKTDAMAAVPIMEMQRLYLRVLGPMQTTLLAVAYVVVVVAALTILTTLYQAAERRRRDIAVMRALGARRWEIFVLVLLEAAIVTLFGIGIGWLLGHGGVAIAADAFQGSTGLAISAWSVDAVELRALGVVALCGVIAGLVPALLTYRRSPVRDLAAV